jgi:hypothetical protein
MDILSLKVKTGIKPYFCSLPKWKGEAHASETYH